MPQVIEISLKIWLQELLKLILPSWLSLLQKVNSKQEFLTKDKQENTYF